MERSAWRHLRGTVGAIHWHTYPAAAINGYTVQRSAAGTTLEAIVVLSDAFKMAQRPLTFVAPVRVGKPGARRDGEFRWPIESFTLAESGRLTARLGPQEKASHAPLPFRRPDPRSPIVLIGG